MKEKNSELINIFNKYQLSDKEKKEIYEIIKDIYLHDEFQKRMTNKYMHHGATTLGEHILEDTVTTYLLCKKSKKSINIEYALKISMMHDLYTNPWQNSNIKEEHFFHKHGFIHPIEAAINSMVWFSDEFIDPKKSEVLIDGIVHHMYPLPVTKFYISETNELELSNYNMIKNISIDNIKLLEKSTNRYSIKKISITRSKYLEGRIMSRADKTSSIRQIKSIHDATALITGTNKSLKETKKA